MGREIIAAGLEHREFIAQRDRAASRPTGPRSSPTRSSLGRARDRGARRASSASMAHAFARAAARHDLLDARHHRAPQRGRQRAGADQPGAAHRPRRPLRLGLNPAARAEQRPGRRRHGRPARPAARLPARRERRAAREVRPRLGDAGAAREGLAPVRDVRGDGARRAARRSTSSARTRSSRRPTSTMPATCSKGSTAWWSRTCS